MSTRWRFCTGLNSEPGPAGLISLDYVPVQTSRIVPCTHAAAALVRVDTARGVRLVPRCPDHIPKGFVPIAYDEDLLIAQDVLES